MAELCIELTIVSSQLEELISVEWIAIEGPNGSFVLLPDHIATISVLQEQGTVKYKKLNDASISIAIKGGMFIVSNNKALLLID